MDRKKKELLELLSKTEMLYRSSLDLNPSDLFGIEIEYSKALRTDVDNYIENNHNNWKSIDEKQITSGDKFGGEVISPILTDSEKTWSEIEEVLDNLKELGCSSNLAASHIHFDSSLVPYDLNVYYDLLKLWCIFETEIYQFSYGELDKIREQAYYFAYPIKGQITHNKMHLEQLMRVLKNLSKEYTQDELLEANIQLFILSYLGSRFNGLSFNCIKHAYSESNNTFEVRTPNGTLDKVIWQNNINFFAKFLTYFKREYDKEFIDYHFDRLTKNETLLNKYDVEKAIILRDMIFKDETDKLYFMKQYTKSLKFDTKK